MYSDGGRVKYARNHKVCCLYACMYVLYVCMYALYLFVGYAMHIKDISRINVYVYVCMYVHTIYIEFVCQNVHCLVLWMYVSKSNIFKLQCI